MRKEVPPQVLKDKTLKDRLKEKLEWRGKCLIWTGGKTNSSTRDSGQGYGKITTASAAGKRIVLNVQHLAWYYKHGYWPDKPVSVICGEKCCVNPAHLVLNTREQITALKEQEGNATGGRPKERDPKENALLIRLRKKGLSHLAIAKKTGVPKSRVRRILIEEGENDVELHN